MKIIILVLLSFCFYTPGIVLPIMAQEFSSEIPSKTYRATPARINDLVHTKLEVRFDYKKSYLYGKEWVTLKPHFYPTDSLRLEAKGMIIKNISVVKNGKHTPLAFKYDSLEIAIKLDRVYRNSENYTIYIDYTAKPTELKIKNDAKGLYFINPDGTDPDKPTQIWTLGQPENSSAWFPTIDKPNQKTTQEISMTVPAKYVTLSNGGLTSQKNNADGTRTDTWKMELPHAPYLFMMAVGDFRIYKDTWRGKEVSYYLNPKYAPYAKDIFGLTPEAITFFSKTLGVDYPWNKYSQITVHDFVGGAMENTTATVFGDNNLGTKRELADQYINAGIAHELFHQWFGNYVTAESWSNLTLNESFADFGEIIWAEYKYGKDAADEHIYQAIQGYLNDPNAKKRNLVRSHYTDKQEVFDGVTYQKGGRVLNMLRYYLGHDAFYKGLNIYLKTNAFKSAEAHQLRLAMEEATGLDLNWFFNQWYFGAGHPELNISYKWNETTKTKTIYVQQMQEGHAFILPIAVDIYAGGKRERHQVWLRNKADTLTFPVGTKPDLVNVDGNKILLAKKTDSKTLDNYVFQYFNAHLFLDRYEAIEVATSDQAVTGGRKILIAALNDKYFGLQLKAINALDMSNYGVKEAALPILISLVKKEQNNLVRAAAINTLGKIKAQEHISLFKEALNSESYTVQGAALSAIALLSPDDALALAKKYEKEGKGKLREAIIKVYLNFGGNDQWTYMYQEFGFPNSPGKYPFTVFADFISRVENPEYAKIGIAGITSLVVNHQWAQRKLIILEKLNQIKAARVKLNDIATAQAVDQAISAIKDSKY